MNKNNLGLLLRLTSYKGVSKTLLEVLIKT